MEKTDRGEFGHLPLILASAVLALVFIITFVWWDHQEPGPSAGHRTVALEGLLAGFVPPRGYVCYRTDGPLKIDGKLDEPSWQAVPWTDDFVDIEGDARPRPRFRTRAKMLWDDRYFYIGAELQEPHVWATLTQHDAVIFNDNDFEVFIDPNGDSHEYYEFEINALNTGWDLLLPKPYKDGGHALDSWEIPGLKTAVFVDGTLNQPADTDRGWSVEIAFPWKVLGELAYQAAPPRDGDHWRVNFSRVEWQVDVVDGKYRKRPGLKEDNWVWSPQGVVDMHRPETWGYVQFSNALPGQAVFQPDGTGPARHLLHAIYYAQRQYREDHGAWARSLAQLGFSSRGQGTLGPAVLKSTDHLFQATIAVNPPDGNTQHWHIRQDARVWQE
jgi:hypothetical protein